MAFCWNLIMVSSCDSSPVGWIDVNHVAVSLHIQGTWRRMHNFKLFALTTKTWWLALGMIIDMHTLTDVWLPALDLRISYFDLCKVHNT